MTTGAPGKTIKAQPLTREAFRPFGELVDLACVDPVLINEDRCRRYTDIATLDFVDGRGGLSLFHADLRDMPHTLTLMERHPYGSQCFIPMDQSEYLVVVAEDKDGVPGTPQAFLADQTQPINIARNTWHGVLTPLRGSGLFAVIDRIGSGSNLEEHRLETPFLITDHD